MDTRYWTGLADDYLDRAGSCIRARDYALAIDNLRGALRNANRAKNMRMAGRCCASIRRLQWLMSKIPAEPVAWAEYGEAA